MTESIALVIFAIVIFLAIVLVRRYRPDQFSPRVESVIRIAACLLAAIIAHALYGRPEGGLPLMLTILGSAILVYGATHLPDRLLVKG
jgi:peptidoglycan/LPS O-acetylase OafA/YrhL